jgi:hypothetical protein
MTDRSGDAQLHDTPRQQSQRPVGIPRRRRTQPQRDQLRLLLPIQQLGRRRMLRLHPLQRLFKPAFHQMLANILHRFGAAAIRLGDLPIRPPRAIGIRLEQNLRPPNLLAGAAQLLYHPPQLFPFFIRQTNHILLFHQSLLALEPLGNDYPNSLE